MPLFSTKIVKGLLQIQNSGIWIYTKLIHPALPTLSFLPISLLAQWTSEWQIPQYLMSMVTSSGPATFRLIVICVNLTGLASFILSIIFYIISKKNKDLVNQQEADRLLRHS